ISSRWLRQHSRRSWIFTEIRNTSEFVLSGDCTHAHLYPPPFGDAPYTTNDCDKDDAVGPGVAFFGEAGGVNAHRDGNNVLFADGHVKPFRKFDADFMTFHPHQRGMSWESITPDDDSTEPPTK